MFFIVPDISRKNETCICFDRSISYSFYKVTASDLDGPINNLLRYSIVSGDLQQQFTIHPRSGEISIRTALDREEVSWCGFK